MERTELYRRDVKAGLLRDADFFVAIDFDGTVTDTDITDAVIKEFAGPGWEEAERLWAAGSMGSRECLSVQMSLISAPLDRLVQYAGRFSVNSGFADFVRFLRAYRVPFAIVSDGFQVFIERLLADAGITEVPVYASRLSEEGGRLKASFPYANSRCAGATCKCRIAGAAGGGLPVIHIGDGRSDFCLAGKAAYVFSKGNLTGHCTAMGISHSPFNNFRSVETSMKALLNHTALPCREERRYGERLVELWNPL